MAKTTCLLAVALLLGAAYRSGAAEPDLSDDVKKVAGTWKGYVVDGRGEKPNQGPVKLEITVKGDTITAVQDGSKDLGEGTFTLKLAKSEKQMDAVRTKNPGKGQTFLGIYSLDGDTLKWCVSPRKKDRPTDFITKTGQFLLILKREKP
jgi:uncharacterized protein (TIGR03067 family)